MNAPGPVGLDTNILLYAINESAPQHAAARAFLESRRDDAETVVSELVLVELYVLLRNGAVLSRPLGSADAAAVVGRFRRHPRWQLVDHDPSVMDEVWAAAARPGFARNRIFDTRLAFGLRRRGVRSFATANVRDFDNVGFEQVWNPMAQAP